MYTPYPAIYVFATPLPEPTEAPHRAGSLLPIVSKALGAVLRRYPTASAPTLWPLAWVTATDAVKRHGPHSGLSLPRYVHHRVVDALVAHQRAAEPVTSGHAKRPQLRLVHSA